KPQNPGAGANVRRLQLPGVRERRRSIGNNSRQAAFAPVARFRYARRKWRGGVKPPSLGSTPGSRTGADNHVDRARKRGKRSLLFASWRRRFRNQTGQRGSIACANRDPTSTPFDEAPIREAK